jgi:parallel beta-helix repeat protein
MFRSSRVTFLLSVASLLLATVAVVGNAAPAAAASMDLTDDSYVDASRPDRNYGSRTSIRIDGSPERISYVKFDVQGSGAPDSALLQVQSGSSGDNILVYAVPNNSWDEGTLTFNNAPPLGALVDSVDGVSSGSSYFFDVSSVVTGDGAYTFAMKTTDNTAMRLGSKEGGTGAQLFVPAPSGPSPFVVTRSGTVYTAAAQGNSSVYTGTLKDVVESAVSELMVWGGGVVEFSADTFNLGADHFEFNGISDIEFFGQGIGVTAIVNNSSASTDTEPFDMVTADRITIRDMTISANGSARSTSDALDFDNGNNITIERVSVVASRGRGIVFDGKGPGWSADGNSVTDCVIDGIPGDGLELLASSNNTISGCTITDVGGHGIQINKASSTASQPNKKSNDNVISNNTINDSGLDGINLNSSDRNQILGNQVLNSSDNVSNRDGIRIFSTSGITCDDNEVRNNTATDNQAPKTQRYGVNISSVECHRTIVDENDLAGNKTGEFNDLGTDTEYTAPPDAEAPSAPTGVTASAPSHFQVDVSWNASTDNVGVDSYTIYRDGSPLQTVGGETLSYSDTTVAAEMTYDYTVEAFDAVGNPSGQSSPPASVTTPAASGSVVVNATHDAYVDSSNDTRNYGSSSALRTDGSPDRNIYMMFDVSGVSGSVASATLRIYAASGSSSGFDLVEVADTTWTEGSITYLNAPALGPVLGSPGSFSAGAFIDIDVSGYVTGDGLVSFGISSAGSTAIRFDSSEGANPPELTVVLGP